MKKIIFILLVISLLFQFDAFAQEDITVHGTVTDDSGMPVPGANIVEQGTSNGVMTDFDGEFRIDVPANAVLVVSFVGFATVEIPVDGQTETNISLETATSALDEVVVIGYGTQKRENVIGSVTSVSAEDITAAPVGNVTNALAGRLPGAIFVQTSGRPGSDDSSISVRGNTTLGNNQPLVVIDGIPGRSLNSINPNDIENINVLKDASAAIYGSRAANGVILVTTKSGRQDMPATLSYSFNAGFLSPTKLPEMTDAPTYARMVREMQSYRDVDEANMVYTKEDIAKYESGEFPWTHPNTDWLGAAMKDYSRTSSHNLSVTGGSEDVTYYGSFGTQSDGGIYTNSATSYDRYNLKANINAEINEYLSLGLNLTGIQGNRMYPTKSPESIFVSAMRMYPTSHAVFPGTNLPGPDIEYGDQPMVSASAETGFDDDKRYSSQNLLTATLKIPGIKGLNLSGYYAYDLSVREQKIFRTPWTLYSLDVPAYLEAGNTGREDGTAFLQAKEIGYPEPRLTNLYERSTTTTANVKLQYDNTFNKVHNVQGFIAYEQNEENFRGTSAFRRFFASEELPYLFAGGEDQKDNNEWVAVDARVNYFGRLMYDYDRTYYFQFSLRRDGSLRFSEENGRWGTFPSALVGYRPSEQKWWQNSLGFIDDFKLRFSWGKLGNDQVPPFQYLRSYGFSQGYVFGAGKNYTSSLEQVNAPNPFITWEVSNMYNFGVDAALFNRRLTFEADLFYERRTDILVARNASVPNFTGLSLPDENFGIVENRGVEASLGYRESSGDLSYGVTGNFAFARNKVVEVDEPLRPVPWQVRTGHPMNALLLYKSLGVYSDLEEVNSTAHLDQARPGDIIIEDYNEDGEINSLDKQLFPFTPIPEITFGLSFDVSYKNWALSGLFQGQSRALRPIYPDGANGLGIGGIGGNYLQRDAVDRWTPENTDATAPRAFERAEEYWRFDYETNYNYADVSFLRLRTLNLSYTLPQDFMNRLGGIVASAKIFVAGQNLALLYSGTDIMDPELVSGSYPIMRVISFGGKLTF